MDNLIVIFVYFSFFWYTLC